MKPRSLPSVGEDVVVLAGDIATGLGGIQWAKRGISDRPVIYVLGNHEFYGGRDFDRFVDRAREECAGSQVHLLEQDAISIRGYEILGCTLWTDFRLHGAELADDAAADAAVNMADYSEIRRRGRRLSVRDVIERCQQSRQWLDTRISAATEPVLVVTHHAPSARTLNPRFLGQMSNAAFHNAFDDLFRPPVRVWFHGHHHFSVSETVNSIPLLSNQRGYPGEQVGPFSWDQYIDLN